VAWADETQQLWLDYRRTGDPELRDRLILTYAPLVREFAGRLESVSAAHVYTGDLISWAFGGLREAIECYDPERDGTFDPYAKERIKLRILDALLTYGWDDSGEGAGGAGVREPRRPLPHALSAEDVVEPAA
jgi:DNA-directed RNA polymerase specialized sigma subunit